MGELATVSDVGGLSGSATAVSCSLFVGSLGVGRAIVADQLSPNAVRSNPLATQADEFGVAEPIGRVIEDQGAP